MAGVIRVIRAAALVWNLPDAQKSKPAGLLRYLERGSANQRGYGSERPMV